MIIITVGFHSTVADTVVWAQMCELRLTVPLTSSITFVPLIWLIAVCSCNFFFWFIYLFGRVVNGLRVLRPTSFGNLTLSLQRPASVAACRAGASLTSSCGSSISRQLLSNLTLISQRYLMLNDRGGGAGEERWGWEGGGHLWRTIAPLSLGQRWRLP